MADLLSFQAVVDFLFLKVKSFFFLIKSGIERLLGSNFVTSSFIYLVLTFAIFLLFNLLESYFVCANGDISSLDQSEIGDENTRTTLYSLAS